MPCFEKLKLCHVQDGVAGVRGGEAVQVPPAGEHPRLHGQGEEASHQRGPRH